MEYKGKDLEYLKNISSSDESVDMMIFGAIVGSENLNRDTVNGDQFAKELIYISNHIKDITININSVGGSILTGFSIIGAMNIARLNGAKITTRIVGIADSMAGMVGAFGDIGRRYAANFSTGVVHGPMAQNSKGKLIPIEDMVDGELKTEALHMKKSLMQLMSSSTGKTEAQVKNQMDKSLRLTAEELKDFGMIDEIQKISNKKIDIQNKTAVELMVACSKLSEIKIVKMELVNKKLGLNADAAENSVVSAIEAIENKAVAEVAEKQSVIDTQKTEIETLQDKVKLMEEKGVEAAKEAATTLVGDLVDKGVFKADSKEALIKDAIANPESFKNMVSAMSTNTTFVDVTKEIQNNGGAPSEKPAMKFAKMRKFDAEGLVNMEKTNPSQYAKLEEAYLESDINIDDVEL